MFYYKAYCTTPKTFKIKEIIILEAKSMEQAKWIAEHGKSVKTHKIFIDRISKQTAIDFHFDLINGNLDDNFDYCFVPYNHFF